jgi:hypothetical protein
MDHLSEIMSEKNIELTIVKQPHKIVVSLWLDNYDNIFSDFDPRSYLHRGFSDDFLNEARKVSQEVEPGVLDLTLLIPAGLRDLHYEKIIRERLHSHFKKQAVRLEKSYKNTIKKGIVLTAVGLIAMMAATAFSSFSGSGDFLMHMLTVIFEPTGWFMTWFGLDLIFYESKGNRDELKFSRKMAHAAIEFDTYAVTGQQVA